MDDIDDVHRVVAFLSLLVGSIMAGLFLTAAVLVSV